MSFGYSRTYSLTQSWTQGYLALILFYTIVHSYLHVHGRTVQMLELFISMSLTFAADSLGLDMHSAVFFRFICSCILLSACSDSCVHFF